MENLVGTNTRYSRQLWMPEWGGDRQARIASARVAVIGAGGVKTTLLTALAAAGIGYIRLVEFDTIEESNLNRQTLYREADVGKQKGELARSVLTALNPHVTVEWINERFRLASADRILADVDIVVEGGDSPANRNEVNVACLSRGLPFVHASAQFNYGYVLSVIPEQKTACFACHFPTDYQREQSTGPVPVSVLSVQVAGSLGAAEVLKYAMGYSSRMSINSRLAFSSLLLSSEFHHLPQSRNPACAVCSAFY